MNIIKKKRNKMNYPAQGIHVLKLPHYFPKMAIEKEDVPNSYNFTNWF